MRCDLRIAQQDWEKLRHIFGRSFWPGCPPETAVLGVLGECARSDRIEFLLAKLFPPEEGDLKVTSHGEVVLSSSYVRRAHLYMRQNNLAGIAVFHTHPLADQHVNFSGYDDHEEPMLVQNLRELHASTRLISVVAGRSSFRGRCWMNVGKCVPMNWLVVIGERLTRVPLNGAPVAPPPIPEEIFDSARSITGAGALAELRQMAFGVVGASGTGSLVCELLLRAGCQRLMLIDDDVAEVRNANRILYLAAEHIKRATPKVEILVSAIEKLGLGCKLEPVCANVLDRDVLARLRDVDLIFGCVDKAYPRKLLSEFSFRYLKPYIDVGCEIGGDSQGIVSVDARATYVAPGRFCLMCLGIASPRQLRLESLANDEREREIALGYSDDLLMKQPAVMDLNMRAASLGMVILRHLLQPFLLEPLPLSITENLVTYSMRKIEKARASRSDCRVCQQNQRFGFGDCGPPIGLDSASVQAIIGLRTETMSPEKKDELR